TVECRLQLGEELACVLAGDLVAAAHRLDRCCAERIFHAGEEQGPPGFVELILDAVGADALPGEPGEERDEDHACDGEPEPHALSHDPPPAAVSAIRSMPARTAPGDRPDLLVRILNRSSRPASYTKKRLSDIKFAIVR